MVACVTAMSCSGSAPAARQPASAPVSGPAQGERAVARWLPAGPWRGVVRMQGKELPFQMEVTYPAAGDGAGRGEGPNTDNPGSTGGAGDAGDAAGAPHVVFINGQERVAVDRVAREGERISLIMSAFNTRIDGRLVGAEAEGPARLEGTLTRITRGGKAQEMPVTITAGEQHRFFRADELAASAPVDVSGRWRVSFIEPDGKTWPAVGEFRQTGSELTGTFLTPTADFRYLAGSVRGDRLYLSAWDGSHVFLFEATVGADGTLAGDFWSSTAWHQPWTAQRDASAALPDMDAPTYLKPGHERFDFSFPDLDGTLVSLSDPRFQGKVVVVQIAGSWCPNCADETRFLAPWYRDNRDRGVEIVSLMFEHLEDPDEASAQVRRWRDALDVDFPVLIAGISDKQDASSRLPQLNAVLAFPTTIFIGRDGTVARIHTGFNGPATGAHHEEEIRAFEATVAALLAAELP